jgi:hypothetical protein
MRTIESHLTTWNKTIFYAEIRVGLSHEMGIPHKSSTGFYKQKLRGWKNQEPPARSTTHWTVSSFEDKKKPRPPNVLVDNLPRGGWKSGEYSNSYSDSSRGSYLGNTKDHSASSSSSSCQDGAQYLGQND